MHRCAVGDTFVRYLFPAYDSGKNGATAG
jgi:hypothetical protein